MVLVRRPYPSRAWCIAVVEAPLSVEQQPDNRWKVWAQVPECGDRFLRVVTLNDRTTIHDAFPDRKFSA